MTRYSRASVLWVTLLCACCHGYWRDSTCENRVGNLGEATKATASAVQGQYEYQLPADFDARAYLAVAQGVLPDTLFQALRSVDLEVWTRDDCQGAMVVARCPGTQRVILIDDTTTTSEIEDGNVLAEVNVKVPTRPPKPPSCPLPAKP